MSRLLKPFQNRVASANIPYSHLQDLVEDFDDVVGERLDEGAPNHINAEGDRDLFACVVGARSGHGFCSGKDLVHEFTEERLQHDRLSLHNDHTSQNDFELLKK